MYVGLEETVELPCVPVRCPNCRSSVDVSSDAALRDITCGACNTHFSLIDEDPVTCPTFSRFDLIEVLGSGSFGTVWKSRDRELDRTVAVKIPHKGQLSSVEAEQFLREARAAAQLRHPNIVGVHEVGREDGQVYIVSDYVEGLDLARWLTAQHMAPREIAGLCAKIADALHHAHRAGVVHRDLKPSNIIIDGDGQPHIMDFGLAKREAGEISVTFEGNVLGTPAYMSPEQAKGESHHADGRADVYSLGVILFELLTGEKPFRGNARMLLNQVINDDAPPPRRFNGSIPRDLETICLKCLEKAPQRRYASAEELATDLRRFLASEPIAARPITRVARLWRWSLRNRAIAGLGATVGGLLMLLAVGGPLLAVYQANLAAEEARTRRTADEVYRMAGQHYRGILELTEGLMSAVPEDDPRRQELASVYNDLAWFLVTVSEPELRDPQQAVEAAERAVHWKPDAADYWRTLGVAQYRAGQDASSIESLQHSISLAREEPVCQWLFLAMACHRLGQDEAAHDWYRKATEYLQQAGHTNELLRHVRAEAAELLATANKTGVD